MNLDRIDFSLLAALTGDARASQVELSDRVGLSSTAVARRQRALEDSGVIQGYRAVLNMRELSLGTTVLVRITLESQSEESLEDFERAVLDCPSVVRCLLMSGTDDYLLIVLAEDIEDFEQIHRAQLSRLPRVARIQSSFAIREVVDRPVPPILFGPERGARR